MGDESSQIEHSAIYSGWIRHRRFLPKRHDFTYPLFMLYLDLDELDTIVNQHWFMSRERFNIVSFKRSDYFKPDQTSLKDAVIHHVQCSLKQQGLIVPSIKSVRLLTHARYFNFVFNPVSFYYCFDEQEELCAILAEITNTPWDERHAYVLPVGQSGAYGNYSEKGNKKHLFDFTKDFHVSPFNPMNMQYQWIFSTPDKNLRVHMDNHLLGTNEKHFDATLVMEHKSLTKAFARTLIRYPIETVKVSMGIYWQALKLWIKRVPFYDHPKTAEHSIPSNDLN